MTGLLERALARWGQEITVASGGVSAVTRAFLQPHPRRSDAAPEQVTPLGTADDRPWTCRTLSPLAPGDGVTASAGRFTVADSVRYELDGCVYWWAALLPERGGL